MATTYDKASLVMIPSGVKESKLYSIKPTDGDGDFTFSRGTDTATRVNSSGLIEKERANLLLQSNTFDTTWVNFNTTDTGGQSGYDGTNDAWLIENTVANGSIRQTISASGVQTYSFYAKKGTTDWVAAYVATSGSIPYCFFDLTNGVKGATQNNVIDSSITDVGGEWYRIAIVFNTPTTDVRIFPAEANAVLASQVGDNIYIQDAQLEQGLVATDYIETTTAAVYEGITDNLPRLDYSGGASCPSLLLEPSRTNGITSSEYLDGSNMVKTTIADTYNTADTLSPEGLYNAAKLQGTGTYPRFAYGTSIADNTDVTISVFAKVGTGQVFTMRIFDKSSNAAVVNFDLQNGTASESQYSSLTPSFDIEPFENGWYRCWVSASSGTGASGFEVRPLSHAVGEDNAWTNGNYIYAYGVQMETSASYPTSYIPTYGTSASRAADSCVKTGISSLLNDSEGTLFLEMKALSDGGDSRRFTISNGSIDNRVSLEYDESAGRIKAFLSTGGTTTGALDESGHPQDENHKIALTYNASAFKIFIDGVLEGSDTSLTGTPIGLDQIEFKSGSGNNPMEGLVKQALVFNTALTDAECIALTTI